MSIERPIRITRMIDKENQALIRSAQAGDKRAFEALISEHYNSMYKMAYKWCGNRERAEDIIQDACIKVARHIDSFQFKSSFSTWLYRIVINTARDHHKREKRLTPLPEDESISVNSNVDDRLYAQQVLLQVQSLPEREKTALLLVFAEGMTHKEAAFSMQCKESTVSWYIHQARKKLAKFTDEDNKHG